MYTALMVVHYGNCFVLIGLILLQAGKGAEIGAVFTGGSQTIFGGRGPATFFQKLTAVLALLFLVTSIALAQVAQSERQETVLEQEPEATAPAAPPPAAPAEKGN